MQDSGARGEGEGTLGRPDVGTAVELIEHVQAWEANKLHVGTGCGLPLSRPCAGIVANARLGGRNGGRSSPRHGSGRRLAFCAAAADITAGGWRWTNHSPTGSGPEGSSPNEHRFGSLVSLPPLPARSACLGIGSLDTLVLIPDTEAPRGRRAGSQQAGFQQAGSQHAGRENRIMSSGEANTGAIEPGGGAYRVLARKYRPTGFGDLIGQDAMVRTISNAFEAGRIPQAWILTGVRGVGKTTTARILARALNYELPDRSISAPTINMPALGVHCEAIMESRHLDVIEMDAASHNSVDDVRQINDAIRYAPVSARYKVYILDEVHMLSGAAFNALLKTLEEPPPHAKFIFATTEIRKVPVTVLSRCQRFDLRRVDAARLVEHLQGIADKEAIKAEPEALALIARAAEGSVRDALSLFDQAIAHAGAQADTSGAASGLVRADDVRQMLGLADRTRIIELFDALMRADVAAALKAPINNYQPGPEPLLALRDVVDLPHAVSPLKTLPALVDDASMTEAERIRGRVFAAKLSMRILARTWQMLLKGIAEVEAAGRPIDAAEMVLVRIAYAADLPTPDEVIRSLGE